MILFKCQDGWPAEIPPSYPEPEVSRASGSFFFVHDLRWPSGVDLPPGEGNQQKGKPTMAGRLMILEGLKEGQKW